jgi:hypothetical protein
MKHLLLPLCLSLFVLKSNAQDNLPSGKTNTENTVISLKEPKNAPYNATSVRDDEKLAISMLNTTEVPKDFPRMQSDMSAAAYEKLVYEWFLKNPDKRKQTATSSK